MDSGEEDAVADAAFDDAAVCHQRIGGKSVLTIVGADFLGVLGANRTACREHGSTVLGIQHIHVGRIVTLYRGNGFCIALMHEDSDLSAIVQITHHSIPMEMETVCLLALFHHLQKEVLGNDISFQRGHTCASGRTVK